MFNVIVTGFLSSFTQIAAIGMQNAFVLRCGIAKNHIIIAVLTCIVCDVLLTLLAVFGIAELMVQNNIIMTSFRYGGAIFLLYYGLNCFKRALTSGESLNITQSAALESGKKVFFTAIMLSIMNPHAILDIVVVVGSISTKFIGIDKLYFFLGAVLSSVVWFVILGSVSVKLSKLFSKKITWQILDTIIGFGMLYLAITLIC
jgi:L-lysine exporter family protein LysE/ArgO